MEKKLEERLEMIRAHVDKMSHDPQVVRELDMRSKQLSDISAKDMQRQFTF